MSAEPHSVRELVEGAYKLLEFGHDPVAGSWQIPPHEADVHQAGALLKAALSALDEIERKLRLTGFLHG